MLYRNITSTFMLINLFITMMTFPSLSVAGLITFESNAAGNIPIDNEILKLSDVFTIDEVDIRFGFDTNNNGRLDKEAIFERADNTDLDRKTGFLGELGRDTAAFGFENQLGNFFIRQSKPYKPFGIFTILYDYCKPSNSSLWRNLGY